MKKLKLNLNELKIESFEVSKSNSKKMGTVHGNVPSDPLSTCFFSCIVSCNTEEYNSCEGGCGTGGASGYHTCQATCTRETFSCQYPC